MIARAPVLGTRAALVAASLAAHAAAGGAWWVWSPAPGARSPQGLAVEIVPPAPPRADPLRAPSGAAPREASGAAAARGRALRAQATKRTSASASRVAPVARIPRGPPRAADLPLASPASPARAVGFAGDAAPSALVAIRPPALEPEAKEGEEDEGTGHGWLRRHQPSIQRRIQLWLDGNPYYPPQARRMWWTGTAHVVFTLRTDGTAADVRIARSTGHDVLDQRAVDVIRRAGPYPRPPTNQEVTVPVVFRLVSF